MKYLYAICMLAVAILSAKATTNTTWTALGISEFMASNQSTIQDEDGDYSPWIELFNPTTNNISLVGYSLTVDTNNLQQWPLPNVTLVSGDFMVIFASGKNRTNNTAELHTNFRPPIDGGFIGLTDPFNNIVSSFNYPLQQPDYSYGSDAATPNLVGFFANPTPDNENAMDGETAGPAVSFSQTGSTFILPFTLQLSSEPNATIYYTTNGTFPTQESFLYTGPLSLTNTTSVRARAFVNSLMPGQIHTETYLQISTNLIGTNSNLPAIVLYNFASGYVPTNDDQYINASIYEPVNGVTSLTNSPTLTARAAIHLHGSSTLASPKKSYDLDFCDEVNMDENYTPLGFPSESDFVLYGPDFYEPVLMHNPLIYELSNESGQYASRTRFVEVYLNTIGGPLVATNYVGIYVLEEKIKWDANRVNITKIHSVDELHPQDNSLPNLTGGYLAKIDRLDDGDTGFINDGVTNCFDYPKEVDLRTPQREPQLDYLTNYMGTFAAVLNSTNYTDPVNGYRQFIDVPSWIDYHIINTVAFNVDMLVYSTYYYKDRNDILHFGPVWDFDRSQGSRDVYDFNPITWGQPVTDIFRQTWWAQLFTDVDFWQAWIDRYEDLREGVLSTNNIYAAIDAFASEVQQQEPREVARWPTLTEPRSGLTIINGYTNNFPGTYQGEIAFSKKWYNDRLNFIDTNFLAKPLFSQTNVFTEGDTLTINSSSGRIFYTTNNTDPRLPGGALSTNAIPYSAPIPLSTNLTVMARVYNVGHHNLTGSNNPPTNSFWSGITTSTYVGGVAPAITQSPASLDAYLGQTPTFTVSITGEPAPALQWYLNGTLLTNQTNAQLTVALTQTNQAGVYSVIASNYGGVVTASFTLNLTPKPNLVVTEVLSSESKGTIDSTLDHNDWWELSNLGSFAVNLQGFRFDDSHASLSDADVITNAVSIAPGESIVLVEDMTPQQFQAWWGATNLPVNLQIITYPSIGFSSSGDAVYVWNAAAIADTDTVTSVTFSTGTRGTTFGYNPTTHTFGALSVAGAYGAFAAPVNGDIGSPGTIINLPRFTAFHLDQTNGFEFSFTTQPNFNYQVQYSMDLPATNWQVLTNFIATSNSFFMVDPVNTNNATQFYRAVASPN